MRVDAGAGALANGGQPLDHCLDPRANLQRQAAAVRVAQHDPRRSSLRGGGAHLQRVVAVARESVEEVLGVEDDLVT